MRGKLMFITGLAAGFVLGSRAGREKYEEIRANAKKVWENPTVQEAAGMAQAQATKLYSEGKDKLQSSKLGEKLHAASGTGSTTASGPATGSSATGSSTTGTVKSSTSGAKSQSTTSDLKSANATDTLATTKSTGSGF